jgi:hypothetical protein
MLFSAGCLRSDEYGVFVESRAAINPGMTLREVFAAGLADYLVLLGNKNVPGATTSGVRPVSADCRQHVLDIHYFESLPWQAGSFHVWLYCDMNSSSAKQLIPRRLFKGKQDLLQALDETYSVWAKHMTFRVESPPLSFGGVYDHYEFTIDLDGRVVSVSPIVKAAQ